MGMSGEQIYANFQEGPGSSALSALGDQMKELQKTFNDLGTSVIEAANTIDAGWKGRAGGAASRGAGPLAVGYSEAAPPVGTAQDLTNAQVSTFNEVKGSVKPVPPMPDKPSGWDNFSSGVQEVFTLGNAQTAVNDYEDGVNAHNAAAQHNVDQMNFYAKSSEYNTSNMPQTFGTTALPDAPNVTIAANREVSGAQGNIAHEYSGGSGGSTQASSVGGSGSGGSFGSSGGGTGGGAHVPGGTGGSGVGGSGVSGSGGSFGSNPAGYATSPSGTSGYPGGVPQGPTTGGTGAGVLGVGPYGGRGSGDRTRSNSGYGGPAFGATGTGEPGAVPGRGGAIGAGPGGNAGGPGASGAGGRLGAGGVIGEEGAAARGAAGAAAGRGAAGGAVPPGARGKGDEDTEHETPDYLVEPDPDDAFGGDLPRTAPPVIGD